MDEELIDVIRKLAALERGRSFVERVDGDPVDHVIAEKYASADPRLMKVAEWLGGDMDKNYEALGGDRLKEDQVSRVVRLLE